MSHERDKVPVVPQQVSFFLRIDDHSRHLCNGAQMAGGKIFMTTLSCWIGQLEVGRDRAVKYAEHVKGQMQALHSK